MENFRKIEDLKELQALSSKALFKTFFHSLEWESFLEQNFKWLKFERYVWNDQALLSVARYKNGGQDKLVSHPFCEYGGPLPLKNNINGKAFANNLLSFFKMPFRISLHPEILNYFSNLPATESPNTTYWIEGLNQTSNEKLWQNLRKTTRNEITKAKNFGLKVEDCKSKKELKEFFNLYLKTAKRNQAPAYPFTFFEQWFGNSQAEILLAKKNNKIVAGSVFLEYGNFIHYFLNASDKGGVEGANHLILWHQLEKNTAKSFAVFDLGGTGKNSPLCVFKQGFANAEKPILEITNCQNRDKEKFNLARKIWGIMPLFVIKLLSPRLLKYKL